RNDIILLEKNGVNAVLIGEAIVTAKDMSAKIKSLLGND
ncbi:MAG: indole-3-glycerol-phosphate synthase TrpC, partial [Candidatus Omnitrophota bacterium]